MTKKSDQAVIQREQLSQLLSFSLKAMFSNSFFAAFLAYVQSAILPLWIVLAWFFSILFVNVIRLFVSQYSLKNSIQTPETVSRRLNIFRIGLIISALLWGVNILLVMNTTTEPQLFIGYLLAGLAAGAALVYAIDYICAISFAVFSLVPVVAFYLLSGDPFFFLVGLSGAFYVLFLVVTIRAVNHRLVDGILLRERAIKNAEEIKQLAFYDSLTGLPNRRLLLERLERALVQSWRSGKRGALLFLDLDHFKRLNDALGHDVGDALLVQVSARLKDSVRESDTVSRFGGDEFVMILENLNEHYSAAIKEVNQITTQMLANLNASYRLINIDYMITSSIGVAMLDVHGKTQQDLLKHADIAMYHAKQSGRNAVSVYDASMKK